MGAGLVALIRRALVAVLTGMAVAAAIRLRVRRRAVPPQTGGWRELRDDELADDTPPARDPSGGDPPGSDPPGSDPGDAMPARDPSGGDPPGSDPGDGMPAGSPGDEASAERG